MTRNGLRLAIFAGVLSGWVGAPLASAQVQPSAQDIVIYAADAQAADLHGWSKITDASAAGGTRVMDPDAGSAKVDPPLASPTSYYEMSFQALANVPYRLWIRQKANNDSTSSDSCWVQFDNSVDLNGVAVNRIGSTTSTPVILEEVSGRGIHGWGWQDNGWGVRIVGPVVIFNTSGTQRVRFQRREDGVSMDQIVLSPTFSSYLCASPGAMKDDTRILTKQGPTCDIVMRAAEATTIVGPWSVAADAGASSGTLLKETDNGLAKVTDPLASPASYFEMTFQAQAGVEYHLWMRGKAPNTSSDSCHVQFDHTVDLTTGAPVYRIGTGGPSSQNIYSIEWVLEDGSGAGISNFGWRDSKWGTTVPEKRVKFDTSGTQRIRCQRREDGVQIDEIILSPAQYISSNPGLEKNDTTIIAKAAGLAPAVDSNLRVLECNIHKCRSTAEVNDPHRTSSDIALMNPTIVGLNEVLDSSSHPATIKADLESMTGVHWYYDFAPQSSGSGQGVLIMSRVPIDSFTNLLLSNTEGAGRVQITWNGHPMNFMCTHLNPDDPAIRTTQVAQLTAWAANFAEPRMIVGDFNATPGTSELSGMSTSYNDGWSKSVTAGTATAYPDNPVSQSTRTRRGRLDYVWYSKNATTLTLVAAQVPDMRDPATYQTDPNGTKNAIGDLLAVGIYMGTPSMILDTHDDKGIRASDHNWTNMQFSIP